MFKNLRIYLIFVSLPFALLLIGAAFFSNGIKYTIARNPHPQINFTIFTIILVGGILIILNARRLLREAKTIVEFSRAIHAKKDLTTLQKMADGYTGETACLLQMVAASGGRSISHQEQAAIEHELTNSRASLLRRNALPQYLTGLLVGMGLLGTFIGLLATLNDISVLISSFADLDMQNASPLLVFRTMIERMKAPMQSMGIAFSASMFGLLGSIILGLMMVGIRRLQGDMFSLLSSEVARHIEIALSHDSIVFSSGEVDTGDVTKTLIRIEERYAEAARLQQRGLSSLIDDIQKQRTDMLRALTEQTEASNNFRGELQQLGRQLGSIFNAMEKGNGEMSAQISEMTVHMAADAKETHKLLGIQVDEQKKLRDALDSYKIEERMAEAARSQQRALSSVIDDLQQQRAEMLRALTEQTEASNNSRGEMKHLGGQLDNIFNVIEKGNDEISTQISELTVHMGADAKQSHLLLDNASASFRSELRQLGSQFSSVAEKINGEICAQISNLINHMDSAAKESYALLDDASAGFRSELQQLGEQLGTVTEKGTVEICTQISELMSHMAAAAKKSYEKLDTASNNLSGELQQLGNLFSNVAEKGKDEVCTQISELMSHMAAAAKNTYEQLDTESKNFRRELQQLGGQLSNVSEKGNDELCSRISEMMVHMAAATKGSHELFGSASSNFRSELQQLGTVMEKGNDEICTQISELLAHMAKSKESDELLALQMDERTAEEINPTVTQE